jgi:ABC-type transport system involved in multi-copper enzyme maturation permease subunit
MVRIKQVMAIANSERRINRRLVRYWVFISLAYLLALFIYLQLAYVHGLFSSYSGTVGAISPRFLLSFIGFLYAVIFLFGTIFLAFDVRARDNRERMSEVLDSRPFTNLELVSGRFLGIFLSSWIPMVVLAVILELLGFILQGLGAPLGEPIEIYSFFSFVFMMAVPALSFTIALVFFITLLVRNRLVAAVIILVFIIGTYVAMVLLPSAYGSIFDITGIWATFFCSEIVPQLATPEGWIQRLSVLLAAFGLLGLSAAVHPRLEGGSRLKLAAGSIVVIIFALSFTGYLFYSNSNYMRMLDDCKKTHEAVAGLAVPDLKNLTGEVKINPGKDLSLDIDIVFAAPGNSSLQKALFTLNPGQTVKSVKDASGKEISFNHENGLLELNLPRALKPGEDATVHLNIEGLPDDDFAFLESAFNITTMNDRESGDIGLFGITPGIFHKKFVALMPGQRWLPMSGPEMGRDDPAVRPVDYFELDLEVSLPEGWLAAGPGRRHEIQTNGDTVSFRFSPPATVPEVALIASRFESRAVEVEGVTLELLIDKRHIRNVDMLAETGEMIREWVGDRLIEAEEYGLGYPYDAITLVEIPNYLRTYGGGWRMDTVMAPPGMLLMREIGFPTARFDTAFRKPENFKDKEGGIQQAKWERLKTFFSNDLSGGNIMAGGARNFFSYQTSAKGPEGLALNYVMETLCNLLVTETDSFFSAHSFLVDGSIDRIINMTFGAYNNEPLRDTSIVDQAVNSATSRPDIWKHALGASLKDIDPWEDPGRTLDVLILKGNAAARSIMDTLGPEKTGKLLASIREFHAGGNFTVKDVMEAGKNLGHDLEDILGDWMGSTDLPGFVCEEAKIYRIQDSEDGNPRYQILFKIRNDEPAPGIFRLNYYYGGPGTGNNIQSDPIRMNGKSIIQYGTIVTSPPAAVFLNPYLSLNRSGIFLTIDRKEAEKIVMLEGIEGVKDMQYSLPVESSIIVDDLDSGFSIIDETGNNGFRLGDTGEGR